MFSCHPIPSDEIHNRCMSNNSKKKKCFGTEVAIEKNWFPPSLKKKKSMLPIITPAACNEGLSQARLALPSKYPSTRREFKLSSTHQLLASLLQKVNPASLVLLVLVFLSPIAVRDAGVASTVSAPTVYHKPRSEAHPARAGDLLLSL